jgi:hypothetical protein
VNERHLTGARIGIIAYKRVNDANIQFFMYNRIFNQKQLDSKGIVGEPSMDHCGIAGLETQ